MLDIIVNIAYVFIQIAITVVILFNISFIKLNKKNILVLMNILAITYLLLFYCKLKFIVFPAVAIVVAFYLYIIFKEIYYAMLVSVLTILIFALGDAFTGFILTSIFKVSYNDILHNPLIKIVTVLIILFVCYGISKFSRRFLRLLYSMNLFRIKIKNKLLLSVFLILTIFLMYSYILIFKNSIYISNRTAIFLNLSLIMSYGILITIIMYYNNENLRKTVEQEYRNKELSQLKEYTNTLEAVSNDLRSFKHDYLNILQIIGGYIESGDLEEMKKFYYNDLMPESSKILVKDRCFMLLQYIKIDALKALISSKIITAQSKDIKVKIEIIEDINELSINLIDICRIIGILFDNAIEASELCDNKFIEFLVLKNENSVTFIINNSCPENTPPIYKIYEKNFSTKGDGRGIGLKSVRDIISEKYKNALLNTKIQDSIFKQELIIVNK